MPSEQQQTTVEAMPAFPTQSVHDIRATTQRFEEAPLKPRTQV